MSGPLDDAVARGLSDAFSKEDMLASNGSTPKNGKMIGNIIATQSDQYKTELALRRMRSILYDRCESLARSEAGGARLGGDGARVVVEGRRKKSMLQFWMVLRNQMGRDLHHVTLSIVVPPPPAKNPDDPRLAGVIGGLASAASGEDGAGEVVNNGSRFAKTVGVFEELRTLPRRVFYHIPIVPAGQEVTARLGGSPLGESPVTFSLWCDEGAREHTKFDGLDELRVQVEEYKKELLAKNDAAEARRKGSLDNGRRQQTEGNGATTKTPRTSTEPSAPGRMLGANTEAERAKTGESPQKLDYAQELQGSWKITEQVENGRDISREMRKNNWVITRTGNTFVIKSDLGFFSSGTWTVDDTKDPVEITQTVKRGQGTGKVRHLIVKLENDELSYCGGDQTPDAFHSPPGRNLVNAKAVRMHAQTPVASQNASGNMRLSFQKYTRAADAGDTGAMAELGHLYMTGQGTPRDLVKAAEMFRKGSDAGNRRCTHELGLCYAKGVGVTQDLAKAYALFKSGADTNDPDSMHDLGICYYYGRGVKADRAEAQKWLTKSAKAGYRPSQQALASIARSGRTPASGKALSPEQARAAVGLLWMFSQMGGSSIGASDGGSASDESFRQYIRDRREAERAETDARIRAREQGIP